MITPTQQQIKTLTGEKCPECMGIKEFVRPYIHCKSCNGTGLPTIEIEKEWVEKEQPIMSVDYFAGFFDGEGCISLSKAKSKKCPQK